MSVSAESKFDDCKDCANRRKPLICRGCDVGESFVEIDRASIDFSDAQEMSEFGDDERDSGSLNFERLNFGQSAYMADGDDE